MIDSSIAQVLGIVPPRPQFELFQQVRSHYDYEDLQAFEDVGFIIGMFYSPNASNYRYESGWWYIVYWLSMPSSQHLTIPHIEEASQDELRAT